MHPFKVVTKPIKFKTIQSSKTGTKFRFFFDYAGFALIPLGVNSLTRVHGMFKFCLIW